MFSNSLEGFVGSISSNVITHSMLSPEPIIPLHPADKVVLYPVKLFILTSYGPVCRDTDCPSGLPGNEFGVAWLPLTDIIKSFVCLVAPLSLMT